MKFRKYTGIAKTIAIGTGLLLAGANAGAQTIDEVMKQIEKHHFQKAMSGLHTIMRNEPANAAAYYHLGGIYLENSMPDSAKYFYEKGRSVNANEPLIYVGMGRYYLYPEHKNLAKAKEQFQKALEVADKKDAFVMQQVADALVDDIITEEGKWAVELAEKAKTLDRKNLANFITLGDAWRLIPGETVKGLEEYRAAADADKSYVIAYYRQGQLYHKLKNTAQSEQFMSQVLTLDPAFAPVYLDMGEKEFDAGNTAKAIEHYKKYISLAGFAPRAQIILGSYYFHNKQYAEAKAELQKAAKYNPSYLLVLRLQPYSDYYLKNYDSAKTGFEKYFRTVKKENIIGQDYMHYGHLLAATGGDSLALMNYKKVLEIDSNVYEIYDTLANIYGRAKKYTDAATVLEQKVRRQTSQRHTINPQDYYSIARNYYLAENFALADTNLAQVSKYYPTWIGGFKFRATVNMRLDPKSEQGLAKPYWEKVIELGLADATANKKDLIDAYNYLGEYNYNQKAFGAVKCYANKMLALDAANDKAKKLLSYLPANTQEECPGETK